jgi:recombination protein RecA
MAKKSFVESVTEEFGEEVLTASSTIRQIIPTSSLAVNVSTGIGGIPKGRFTHIYGPDSAGKTTIGLDIAKNSLLHDGRVLYLDVEQTLDEGLVHNIIGDLRNDENFVVAMPRSAEDAFVLTERAIDSGEFDLIIFDSIGALAPEKELDDDFGDAHYALVARLMTTFFKRNAFTVRTNDIAFVFLNQVRANIGSFIKTFELPGGHALKHYSSLTISLFKSEKIELKKGDPKTAVGNKVKFSMPKNKVGVPHRAGTFPIVWGDGIHPVRDVIDFATDLGVLSQRGPYKAFEDETLGLGILKTIEILEEDKELLDKIVESCYNAVGVQAKSPNRPTKEEIDGT